jgi:hypothetical protein
VRYLSWNKGKSRISYEVFIMEQRQKPYIVSPRASVEESAHEALLYVELAAMAGECEREEGSVRCAAAGHLWK